MPRTRSAAQGCRNFFHVDKTQYFPIAIRIHFIHRWSKQHIDSRTLRQFAIPFQIARIIGIIFLGAKLQRVDKQRGDDKPLLLPGPSHQGQMPFVKVPHCRNQPDGFSLAFRRVNNLLQLAYFRDNLHQQHLIIRSEKNNAFPQTGRRISSISTCVPRLGHQGSKRCREYRIVFSEHFVQLTKDAALLRVYGSISLNNSQEY